MVIEHSLRFYLIREDGLEIGGSGVHFPSTPVKHLADLRSRANSQWYSSIYEDQRPKIEDIERSDDRKTRRTNLTGLKPAEDFFFFSFLLSPWIPSSFLSSFLFSFLIPSILYLFYSFFLPSFIYSVVLIFVKIPSYLASDLSLFLLPSFLSFSIPFSPPSLLPPTFSFSHRWHNKTWSAKKTRVRPCYTHKLQLKTSEHRRLRRQHHWIPLAFYHRSSYHKPRESEQINLRSRG